MDGNEQWIGSLNVAPVALGTMYFGTRVDGRSAHECLAAAFDVGATFWDTANNYAFWANGSGDESETLLGQWFSRRGSAAREQVTLATKIGARPRAGHSDLRHVTGLSAPAVRDQITDSLRRLQTDHVDLLYAHMDDPNVPLAETVGEFSDLVDEGLVRELAASNYTAERFADSLAVGTRHRYRAIQQRCTYLEPNTGIDTFPQVVLDERTEQLAAGGDISLIGYSPLLSGSYTRSDRPLPPEYRSAANRDRIATLRQIATAVGLDSGGLVLAWMAQRPQPVTPVVGVSRPEHVRDAWRAITTELPADVVTLLEEHR